MSNTWAMLMLINCLLAVIFGITSMAANNLMKVNNMPDYCKSSIAVLLICTAFAYTLGDLVINMYMILVSSMQTP